MKLERALAEWAADTPPFGERPVELAGNAFVDIAACMIAGAADPVTARTAQAVMAFGSGRSLAFGTGLRLPAPWAALVSGTAAHALDFDDNFAPATTHATAVLAPALFALADEEDLDAAELLSAYIIGLELQARIGRSVNPSHYESGWHGTATIGAIGTAGACARFLGLGGEQILAAMSIASSMAAGSKKQFGSMMKPLHAGLAAKNAVVAARLAQAGIIGDTQWLGGRWGFSGLYGGSGDEAAATQTAMNGLGDSLAIENDGLLTKRFPCCASSHRTLDGIAELRARHGIVADQVARIEVTVPEFARANLRYDAPEDEAQARFSLTYCGARVLQSGTLTLEDFTPARIHDPAVREWFSRFEISIKPGSVADELGPRATPAMTRLILKRGEAFETMVVEAKGSPSAPLNASEIHEKFQSCCNWAGVENMADTLFVSSRALTRTGGFADFSTVCERAFERRVQKHWPTSGDAQGDVRNDGKF